jgi:KDO2-lipid IV(A) lauroyltransferase
MRSRCPPLRHRIAGRALAGAGAVLRWLPGWLAYALSDVAALCVAAFALVHGRALRLWLGWARHLSRLAVDFCRLPRIDASNVERHVETQGMRDLVGSLEAGQGLICVSGHLGFWELLGHAPSLLGMPVTIVVRPLSIGPIDAWVNGVRRSGGQCVLTKQRVLLSLKKALDRGQIVGFLADEDTSHKPVFAPFLGTVAATSPVPAFLQRATGAPIAVVSCHRIARERFRFHVWDVIHHEHGADAEAHRQTVTRRLNAALSRAILAHPAQWLWGSRRFRTRPPGERPGTDGLPPRAPADDSAATRP